MNVMPESDVKRKTLPECDKDKLMVIYVYTFLEFYMVIFSPPSCCYDAVDAVAKELAKKKKTHFSHELHKRNVFRRNLRCSQFFFMYKIARSDNNFIAQFNVTP